MLPKIYVIVQVCILEEHEILRRHGFNILLALPFFNSIFVEFFS